MIRCKHCGCYFDATIPPRNLCGIDATDIADAHSEIEAALECVAPSTPNDGLVRRHLQRALDSLERSGQIAKKAGA